MPEEVEELVASRGVPQAVVRTLEEAIGNSDVLYVTRIQKERFDSDEGTSARVPLAMCALTRSFRLYRVLLSWT